MNRPAVVSVLPVARAAMRAGVGVLAGAALVAGIAGHARAAEPGPEAAPDVVVAPVGAAAADRERPAAELPELRAAPPRWSTSSDYSRGDYRWSLSRGALDVGLKFDTPSRIGANPGLPLESSGPMVQSLPSLSLGLRTEAPLTANSLIERATGSATARTSSRVAIEWKPAESQLMFLRQGLGIRLSGDDRITMRLRGGTLGIYMKRQF
ncbi:MAG: hypothetical protein ACXWJA_08165 [Caldimonas sp.]